MARYVSPYAEGRADPISFRLPKSLDLQVRQAAGDRVQEWIIKSIQEKLDRE